MSKSTEATDMP